MPVLFKQKNLSDGDTLPPRFRFRRRGSSDDPAILLLPQTLQMMALADTFAYLSKWEAPVVIGRHTAHFLSIPMPAAVTDDADTKLRKRAHNAAVEAVRDILNGHIPNNILFIPCFGLSNESYKFQTSENAFLYMGKNDPLPDLDASITVRRPLSFVEHERMAYQEIAACIPLIHEQVYDEQLLFLHSDSEDGQLVPARLDIDVAIYDETLVKPMSLDSFYFRVGASPTASRPKLTGIDLSAWRLRR